MTLNQILKQKNLTKYQLSNLSHVPYSTICDLFNEKTQLRKSSVEVVYKIAKALNTTIELLLESIQNNKDAIRTDLETFKSNMKHQIHETDDLTFIETTVSKDLIMTYFERKWYSEALYTLAMLDYLSRLNSIPLYTKYNSLRKIKLKRILYPASLIVATSFKQNKKLVNQFYQNSIAEFKRFNIVENEVRNVI